MYLILTSSYFYLHKSRCFDCMLHLSLQDLQFTHVQVVLPTIRYPLVNYRTPILDASRIDIGILDLNRCEKPWLFPIQHRYQDG